MDRNSSNNERACTANVLHTKPLDSNSATIFFESNKTLTQASKRPRKETKNAVILVNTPEKAAAMSK